MDMPTDVLKEHIESAQKWASEMKEAWTDTLIGDFIGEQQSTLKIAVGRENWQSAYEAMEELVQLCHDAEKMLEEQETHE